MKLVFCLALVVLLLAPRFMHLGEYLVADENLWIIRSVSFINAIADSNLAGTFQSIHPGVTVMWIAGLAMGLRTFLGPYDWWLDLPMAGQLAMSSVSVACILAIYVLLRKLLGFQVAIICMIFIVLDPFYLAHSKVVHLDATLTNLMFLSVLMAFWFLEEPSRGKLLISGALWGFALLTKLPAIFLAPLMLVLFLKSSVLKHANWRAGAIQGLTHWGQWALAAGTIMFLFWPAMWAQPFLYISNLFNVSVSQAHETGSFFLGQPVQDPGALFYPVVLLFRTTPLSLILSLLCVIGWLVRSLVRREPASRVERMILVCILYLVFYVVLMSIGAKKLDRYVLPVFPAIDVLAGIGAVGIIQFISRCFPRIQHNILIVVASASIIAVQAFQIEGLLRYPLAYYNPLAGGPKAALENLPVGRGEGLDQVAVYLNALPEASNLNVASEFPYLLDPYFEGTTLSTHIDQYKQDTLVNADYLIVYVHGIQADSNRLATEVIKYHTQHDAEHVVTINGIEYAYIYRLQ